ncbi:SUMF1/EgtB/PvdO family nonheme iron enzyme [Nostoc ellipsosporum NOK]|nr:SUMF1/EgtB/PvdO family nonheme iron enzyme [Nostoc ellipsosporum NOK]
MNKIVKVTKGDRTYCLEFAFCPPGEFRILTIPKLAVKNAIVEYTKGFWLQTTPVSLGLSNFIFPEKKNFYDCPSGKEDMYPWYGLDFRSCLNFLEEINSLSKDAGQQWRFDMPTSTEWEHALLCGEDGLWSWGDDESQLSDCAWYRDNSDDKPHFFKEKKCNQWGLFDMYGNVSEYCYSSLLDFNLDYFRDPVKAPVSPTDALPCMGGSYESSMDQCQSFNFIGYENEFLQPTGLRLILRNDL